MKVILYIEVRSLTRVGACAKVKEKVMSQNQQYKKVKLYRTLKVVFYMLGLPLFLLAVFFTAVRFLGQDPFMGGTTLTTKLGFFAQIESYITAPALYGVWIAFALWAVISIVHIILSKTVKNQRVRMFAVIATCLVVMLVTGFVMDAVFEAKIEAISADAYKKYGDSVTVADYKTQLSYYRHLTSSAEGKSETLKLINQVNLLKNAYNVDMEGVNKGGVSGNISNKPITYGNIISDNGEIGVDISFTVDEKTGFPKLDVSGDGNVFVGDGKVTDEVEGNQVVRLAPNSKGELVINGEVYSHYWYKQKDSKEYDVNTGKTTKTPIYVWYTKDMMPTGTVYENGTVKETNTTDGIYGTGLYNENGMMSDGWVFSLDNVLNILADYYESKDIVEDDDNATAIQEAYETAVARKEEYYTEEADEYLKALYTQEVEYSERFSLTRGRLDELVAYLGALLGDNQLFDLLLKRNDEGDIGAMGIINSLTERIPMLGDIQISGQTIAQWLGPILEKLEKGWSLKDIAGEDGFNTAMDYIKAGLQLDDTYAINDAFIVLAYKSKDLGKDNLYVALVKDDGTQTKGKWNVGTDTRNVKDGGDVLLDIDFSNALIEKAGADGNPEYAFDLDHLSEFLNTAINGLLNKFGVDLYEILVNNTIGKLLGDVLVKDVTVDGVTYKGLEIRGLSIPLFQEVGESFVAAVDISAILLNLVDGLYYYQSPVIKPWWEFLDPSYSEIDAVLQKYYRAEYEGKTYGSTIGSTLIADGDDGTIGAGTYPASLGLTSLAAVRQLQVDLSYKTTMYPLFGLRDMIMFFTGIVVFFYFLSFVCAEKEIEYATGKAVVEERKKRSKKNKNADEPAPDVVGDTTEVTNEQTTAETPQAEDTALPVDENTQKEVL